MENKKQFTEINKELVKQGLKKCSVCLETKDFSCFFKDKQSSLGITPSCKSCRREQYIVWYEKNKHVVSEYNKKKRETRREYYSSPEIKAKYRNKFLKEQYGIGQKEYDTILSSQKGVCAICKKFRTSKTKYHMVVDHDHNSGKVRGILCSYCNSGLGHFEDNIGSLSNAIEYLKLKRE